MAEPLAAGPCNVAWLVMPDRAIPLEVRAAEAEIEHETARITDRSWRGDSYIVDFVQREGERAQERTMVFPAAEKLRRLY